MDNLPFFFFEPFPKEVSDSAESGFNVLLPTKSEDYSVKKKTGNETEAEMKRGLEVETLMVTQIEANFLMMKHKTFLVTCIEANALLISNAEIIRTIEGDTATIISVERNRGTKDRRVEIVGSEKALSSAKLKISEAISKLKHMTLSVTDVVADILRDNPNYPKRHRNQF